MKHKYLIRQLRRERERIQDFFLNICLPVDISAATFYAYLSFLGVSRVCGRPEKPGCDFCVNITPELGWYYTIIHSFDHEIDIYITQPDKNRIKLAMWDGRLKTITDLGHEDVPMIVLK
jgi:hypothetical protein